MNASSAEPALAESRAEERGERLSDRSLFFRKFLAKGTVISSVAPSSQSLVRCILSYVDFDKPSTIVELGAGTGPLTERILERLQPHHRFVAVENDPDFCEILRRRFPETPLLEANAANISGTLASLGIRKVDYVLSCLPTPNLPKRDMVRLWRWLGEALNPGGLFVQITEVPLYYRNFYNRLFDSVDYSMVWWNIPPGGVYCCAKPRSRSRRR